MMRSARPDAPAVENSNRTDSPSESHTPTGAFVHEPPEHVAAASEFVK